METNGGEFRRLEAAKLTHTMTHARSDTYAASRSYKLALVVRIIIVSILTGSGCSSIIIIMIHDANWATKQSEIVNLCACILPLSQ